MRSHAGVASCMFQTLVTEGINVQMISTSEIGLIVVDARYADACGASITRCLLPTGHPKQIMNVDPVQLEIFKSLFIPRGRNGATLKRTAFSPNIKERRDYSCAVFDHEGNMVSQGDHMPVHLGSMPLSVQAAIQARKIGPGDMVILNDPYAGGTHLPDITLVSGVLDGKVLRFYFASRLTIRCRRHVSGSMPVAEIYRKGSNSASSSDVFRRHEQRRSG
jgi:hypothetical protein